MIDINKKYKTASGKPVRILCTDRPGDYPVVALVLYSDEYTSVESMSIEGKWCFSSEASPLDLVEVFPWEDFEVDEPVWVRNNEGQRWEKRHFARVVNGRPNTWENGCSSWTVYGGNFNTVPWNFCLKAGDLNDT